MSELSSFAQRNVEDAPSQATQVEMHRALAEVMVAAELAARFPRDEARAHRRIMEACARPGFAERAEYNYPGYGDGGKPVIGPSIEFAVELARMWGNISYKTIELSRDMVRNRSEVTVFAWDVEAGANVSNSRTFIVPHETDTKTGRKPIKDNRGITNQINNAASRSLRETILRTIPSFLVDEALAACHAALRRPDPTLDKPDATPAQVRRRKRDAVVEFFARAGVTRQQLEGKTKQPADRWDDGTIARLGVLYRSLQAGTVTVEDEFGSAAPSAAEVPQARPDAHGVALARNAEHRPSMDDVQKRAPGEEKALAETSGPADEPTEAELAEAYELERRESQATSDLGVEGENDGA